MSLNKISLSGSRNGMPITITKTASPGDTIHTAVNSLGTATWDEIWVYANNIGTVDTLLYLEYGGTQTPYQEIRTTVSPYIGAILVVPGFILQNGYKVSAYAGLTNVININGYVNTIRE